MLTIFTVPKPFDGHIGLIQDNAIGSWVHLHPEVQVLLLGDESGIEDAAQRLGARHIGGLTTNELGTPLVSSVFDAAQRKAAYASMLFVNTDVLFMPDVLRAVSIVSEEFERFLVVGQRWDLEVRHRIEFTNGWESELKEDLASKGRLHAPAGSDYFAFQNNTYSDMPHFAIGRAGWDNWMIYAARRQNIPVIDATGQATAVHQNHDYRHLPHGQPHYRLPESQRNLRLSGGPHTVFTLADTNWKLVSGRLVRSSPGWRRSTESRLLAKLGPGRVGAAAYAVLHPFKSYRRVRGALRAASSRTSLEKENSG